MKLELKGTIEYTISIEDNRVTSEYNSTQDNDIAAMAIAQKLIFINLDSFRQERDSMPDKTREEKKVKEWFTGMVNSFKQGLKGTSKILGMWINNYEGYKEERASLEKLKDEKHEQIKKYLNDNNITVENGVMNQEDAEKLLKEKYPDLMKEKLSDFGVEGNDDSKEYKENGDVQIGLGNNSNL